MTRIGAASAALVALALLGLIAPAARAEDLTHCRKGQALLAKDQAGARTELKLCLASGKLSAQSEAITHMNLAAVAFELRKWPEVLGEYDAAERSFKAAGKPFKPDPLTYYNRGVAYAETGKFKQARTELDAAAKLAPKQMPIFLVRMNVLNTLGQTDAALADGATLAGSGQPLFAYQGLSNRSAILEDHGRSQEALVDADKAIALAPKEALAYNNRCMAAASLKRADAIASCEKAIAIAPKNPSYWNSLGYAYEMAGKLKEAEAQYAKVAAVEPRNGDNNRALARVRAALQP